MYCMYIAYKWTIPENRIILELIIMKILSNI